MEEVILANILFWNLALSLLIGRNKGHINFLPLLLAGIPALGQTIGGILQKNQANNLKKSTYVPPELMMNRDLAAQQAYSRRAPGTAQAEEQNRRLQANQIAGAQRSFGGDANKMAAVASASTAQATDANARIAAQGQQFSENAFGRLSNANTALAQNDRQNQDEYVQTKNALDNAGNTNIFSGVSNMASAGLLASAAKGNKTSQFLTGTQPLEAVQAATETVNNVMPSINTPFKPINFGRKAGRATTPQQALGFSMKPKKG